jgi:cytochrome c-type biogenesis protein CcmH
MAAGRIRRAALLTVALWAGAALADPALDARAQALGEQLRCLVCQNETVAASHAELAQDLRAQIREQLAAGRSDAEVRDFMVARYGEFVLYRPPWSARTGLLWLGPFAALLAAVVLLVRRNRRPAPPPALSEADWRRAQRLLDEPRSPP